MPKLNPIHIIDRLENRIEQLEHGESLEARDINALLNPIQQEQLKEARDHQREIRNSYKTKAAAERDGLVWKTIREVRLDVYRQALSEAIENLDRDLAELYEEKEKRAARIFMAASVAAEGTSRNKISAGNIAVTRAGLSVPETRVQLGARDKEVQEMEDELRKRIRANMSPDELEQLELLEEHERAVQKARK